MKKKNIAKAFNVFKNIYNFVSLFFQNEDMNNIFQLELV